MIKITTAQINELSEIKKLLSLVWNDTYNSILSKKNIHDVTNKWHNKDFLEQQLSDPKVLFLTAKTDDNKIVGIATVEKKSRRKIHLGRLYIHPEYQGQKIGKQLLDYIIKSFPEARIISLGVIKENIKAIKFYQKYGFKIVTNLQERINNTVLNLILMEKLLSKSNHKIRMV